MSDKVKTGKSAKDEKLTIPSPCALFNFCVLPAVAAAAVSATTTASAAAMIAAATASVFAWTGFVNNHIAAIIFLSIELSDRGVGRFIVSHFDETKPARTAGLAVVNDIR
jgi:hypothetical protein